MDPILPEDITRAAEANPDEPFRIASQNGRVFYLVTDDLMHGFINEQARVALQIGLQASARGEVDDWDVEDVKRRGRQRLADTNG